MTEWDFSTSETLGRRVLGKGEKYYWRYFKTKASSRYRFVVEKDKKDRCVGYTLNSEVNCFKDNKNKRKLKDRKRRHDDKRSRSDHYSIETKP